MPALALIFIAAATYVSHSVLIKYASGKIDPYVGFLFWIAGVIVMALPAFAGWKLYGTSAFSLKGALGVASIILLTRS